MKFLTGITATLFAILVAIGANTISQAAEKGAITKVKGGYTVEELYAKKDELKGKKVSVRGKVVKFNGGIMGRNWVHLRDGSGKPGADDITVTTNQNAKVGGTVVATGVVAVDKDFGSGYRYEVILEEADLAAE
ncbi:MAG: hypothetical protein HY266_07395 [Deltaproteobacteria bacterium]|nr:hypothetical protein [Deltaproteobacteria bacterium]